MATLQGILKPAPQVGENVGLDNAQALFIKRQGDSDYRVAIIIDQSDIIGAVNLDNGESNVNVADNSIVYLKSAMGFDEHYASQVIANFDDAYITYTPSGHNTY